MPGQTPPPRKLVLFTRVASLATITGLVQWAADKVARVDRWVGDNWANLRNLAGPALLLLGGCYRGLKLAWEINKGRAVSMGVINPEGAALLGLCACGVGMALEAVQIHRSDWK